MKMMPMPEPIEGTAMVLIFSTSPEGKKRSFQATMTSEQAFEVEKLSEEKCKELNIAMKEVIQRTEEQTDG